MVGMPWYLSFLHRPARVFVWQQMHLASHSHAYEKNRKSGPAIICAISKHTCMHWLRYNYISIA